MPEDSGRQHQLFSNTVTEIFVILLFVFLFLIAVSSAKRSSNLADLKSLRESNSHLVERVTELENQNTELRNEMTGLNEFITRVAPDSTDDFLLLVRQAAEQEGRLLRLEEERELLESKLSELRDELAKNENKLHEFREALGKEASELVERLAALEVQESQLSREHQECEARVANLSRRLGGQGMDHPACWFVESPGPDQGKVEYALEVTLHESSLSTVAAWPEYRSEEAAEVPGLKELVSTELDESEFSLHASRVLGWSRKQDPECRHFVRVVDETQSKEAFKEQLFLVEGFFYKYIERE